MAGYPWEAWDVMGFIFWSWKVMGKPGNHGNLGIFFLWRK